MRRPLMVALLLLSATPSLRANEPAGINLGTDRLILRCANAKTQIVDANGTYWVPFNDGVEYARITTNGYVIVQTALDSKGGRVYRIVEENDQGYRLEGMEAGQGEASLDRMGGVLLYRMGPFQQRSECMPAKPRF